LVQIGMRQDWSWRRSAEQYLELYRKIITSAQPVGL
jgi:glycogen synthase